MVFGRRPALRHRVLAARKVAVAIIRAGLVPVRLALLAEAVAGTAAVVVRPAITVVVEAAAITAAVAVEAVTTAEAVAIVVVGTQPPAALLAERTAANLYRCLIC